MRVAKLNIFGVQILTYEGGLIRFGMRKLEGMSGLISISIIYILKEFILLQNIYYYDFTP